MASQKLVIAQELPPIENFSPIDYGAENQNWGISQSKQKNIYAANNGGLLEFNGAVWKLYGSPNGSTIRSVKALDNTVYTGCYMEFGFWEKNAVGDLEYTSISNGLTFPLLEDEEFWNIVELDEWVLFQSLERIYIYNTSDKTIKVIDSKSTKAHMFNFNGTIYFHSTENGLFKIENGKSVLVSDDPILKNSIITGIFAIENKPLLVTEEGEFYFMVNGSLIEWKTSLKQQSTLINVYSSLQLDDDSIVLGTISNGILHIDKEGKTLQKINQEKGLNNNTVLSLFEDTENNLWLALDNGISVVNIDSPFNEYIDKNGKLGVVYASAIFNDYLYLGTNQGLFYKPVNSDEDFRFVKGTEGQVWLLKVINITLFCGHNKGTFKIEQDRAELISDFPGTWDMKPIPSHNNLLLQGNFNGLSVLEKLNGKWTLRNEVEGFDISSRFFEFVGENRIVVNRELKGVFKLNLSKDYRKVVKVENEVSKGVGASLVTYLDDILYTCDNGIFKYNSSQAKFVLDTLLTNAFYEGSDNPIGIFIPDEKSKRLWCFTSHSIAYASPGKFDANSEINKIAIPAYVRKNLGVLGFESLTPLGDEKYLVGISNGYLTVDLNKLASKEYQVLINSISNKTSDSAKEKVSKENNAHFEFSKNNLFFSYNVPEFDKYTEVNYQYQLEGIYDVWSDWSRTSNISFENLPFGNYEFKVRAKIGGHLSMNTATYAFRIERPWYLSNFAIFIYVLGFVLLSLLIHRLYKNYYKKQREQLLNENKKKLKRKKLKSQKKIIQIKNEKLREEVESKNRELAISTMSIIKKNEFLNAIKDQLKGSEENPQVKSVIRTIDRNINNSDDWKFFEDAFNNADKDFLKKVKNTHPGLTANDLRLCAYLRLNLSSKEIAPLLNISVRSVEVKRYRLRKKMNLPHEDGLTDYIMEI
ncbi:triple tyrosine motif-containing protein [Maribacter algarum]|uniref:helix-turn-helix and ligand-binding sensor domain-containing protein n=1 Tax=Maribacter algarum (ex Zhang et al. 2020) TaxID=2578118 RepID=UPI001EE6146C|nr:triple tyrosine motif-containing protein [Maribacter algarum]